MPDDMVAPHHEPAPDNQPPSQPEPDPHLTQLYRDGLRAAIVLVEKALARPAPAETLALMRSADIAAHLVKQEPDLATEAEDEGAWWLAVNQAQREIDAEGGEAL